MIERKNAIGKNGSGTVQPVEQRELQDELKNELTLQRALSGGSRHQLSQLEREMREAEQEAAGN